MLNVKLYLMSRRAISEQRMTQRKKKKKITQSFAQTIFNFKLQTSFAVILAVFSITEINVESILSTFPS